MKEMFSIKTDRFGYIIKVEFKNLNKWINKYPKLPIIHFKKPIQPEHRAVCDFYIRCNLTKNTDLVTCDSCKELIKKHSNVN